MNVHMTSIAQGRFCGILALWLLWATASPVDLVAQVKGEKAVYQTSTQISGTAAWVDASAFCTSGGTGNCSGANFDFCAILNAALAALLSNNISPAGGVVDARGVLPVPATTIPENCNSNPFPTSLPQANPYPITILLPAYVISLNEVSGAGSGTWVLPNNVKLVGVGTNTVLKGTQDCCSGAVIEMGPDPGQGNQCPSTYSGIAVEHLQVNTYDTGGIDNECAGPPSYVNDVRIAPDAQMSPTGISLKIGTGAANSGPYTNVEIVAGKKGVCEHGSFSCVDVEAPTRGLHGVTCLGNDTTGMNTGQVGILVNASNNSIEDVHVESFWDGIEIGDTLSNVSNVLVSNIQAATGGICSPPGGYKVTNTVHLCGPNYNTNLGPCTTYSSTTGALTDVTILQAANKSNPVPVVSVQDDRTGNPMGATGGM